MPLLLKTTVTTGSLYLKPSQSGSPLPGNGLQLHSREAEGGVALDDEDLGVSREVATIEGGGQSVALSHSHRA